MKFHLNLVALSLITAISAITPVFAEEQSKATLPVSDATLKTPSLNLERLIQLAIERDATRQQLIDQSNATLNSGLAKATLADPTIKVGFGGVPVDSFRLDQDPMSNISLGIMQKFDRGDTKAYQAEQAQNQAQAGISQATLRSQEVTTLVTELWLELGYSQKSEQLMLEQKRWLKQLVESLNSNYALGLSESQDVITAQLSVSQLEQKLLSNQQMQHKILAQLSEWFVSNPVYGNANGLGASPSQPIVASNQHDWPLLESKLQQLTSHDARYTLLRQHPMLQTIDASILAAQSQVSIAQQAYSPQFGVELMYAHRQANNMRGEPAPDMVSAYLTLDIPLFTGNKQDRAHAAAQYQVGAVKSLRDAWLAKLNSQLNRQLSERQFTLERIDRYRNSLLKQAKAQRLAVEQGYQNNSANFGDVVTTSINQLTLELDYQRLITDLNLINNQLANLLSAYSNRVNATNDRISFNATRADRR